MAMKKQFLKSRPVCKVTFAMPKQASVGSQRAHLVGDFNEWQIGATPLKRRKDGTYAATVELRTGQEYQYRFVLDDDNWVNDPSADGYVPTPYGNDQNCVVSV
jgi:1,4-alpha-glucan branching enzyme